MRWPYQPDLFGGQTRGHRKTSVTGESVVQQFPSRWYNGFSGLISATAFKVKSQCDQQIDPNCEGMTGTTGLVVTPTILTLTLPNGSQDLAIGNGKPPYTIETKDDTIAAIGGTTLDKDGTIAVTAQAVGSTTITVTDYIGSSVGVSVSVTNTIP